MKICLVKIIEHVWNMYKPYHNIRNRFNIIWGFLPKKITIRDWPGIRRRLSRGVGPPGTPIGLHMIRDHKVRSNQCIWPNSLFYLSIFLVLDNEARQAEDSWIFLSERLFYRRSSERKFFQKKIRTPVRCNGLIWPYTCEWGAYKKNIHSEVYMGITRSPLPHI